MRVIFVTNKQSSMTRLQRAVLFVVAVSLLFVTASDSTRTGPQHSRRSGRSGSGLSVAAETLSKQLDPVTTRRNRLAVSILHTHAWSNTHETRLLLCCLSLLHRHIMHSTPADVFIFHRDSPSEGMRALLMRDERVHLFPIPEEDWQLPAAATIAPAAAAAARAGDGAAGAPQAMGTPHYQRMTHWRLTSQMKLMQQLEYDYMLQLDHDMFVLEPLASNLVQDMQQHHIDLAWRDLTNGQPPSNAWGLAELARYHVVAHNITPTQLLQHVTPTTLQGLFTPGSPGAAAGQGWDQQGPDGYFLLVRLGFWHSPPVQSFLDLVLRTAGRPRFSWSAQQVVGMVWQLFAAKERSQQLEFNYRHARSLPSVMHIEECEAQTSLTIPA